MILEQSLSQTYVPIKQQLCMNNEMIKLNFLMHMPKMQCFLVKLEMLCQI